MSMNPESRNRAVEVMAREQAKNSEFAGMSDEPEFWVHDCERMLDALLAAGFHVAEWRKVDEADRDGAQKLLQSSYVECMQTGCYEIEYDDWWLDSAERFCRDNEQIMVMDLPDPPKTEGDA